MPNLNNFPQYFREYQWEDKHSLYGYPEDVFPNFLWIYSLENRFCWLKNNCSTKPTVSLYLIREMIQWGGSQNGVLQKFEDGSGEVNLQNLLSQTIANINNPANAIKSALKIPGMGLTYASKLLRFIEPEIYGALDSRVRKSINERAPNVLPNIYDGNTNSMVNGYIAFIGYLATLKNQLEASNIVRPNCSFPASPTQSGWRAADIEMALFQWAESNEP